jgi:hypothetical protein
LLNALLLAPYIALTGKDRSQVEGIKHYRYRAPGQSILLRKAITKYGSVRGRDDGRFLAAYFKKQRRSLLLGVYELFK